jgi:DnaK suppressor protein
MAARKNSLVGRAGAAARAVVSRSTDDEPAAEPEVRPAKKATKKTTAKKTAKKTSPATKAAKTTTTKKAAAPAAQKTAQKTAQKAAKKAATKKAAPQKSAAKATSLVVLEKEDPWTEAEVAGVREHLHDDVARLTTELAEVEGDLAGMIENPGEGAGHDQADVGSASFERDQERQIVNNARDMLEQSQHALERIDDGSYGQCESCGNPIGKNRLMAFPRATLCLTCKQREERR